MRNSLTLLLAGILTATSCNPNLIKHPSSRPTSQKTSTKPSQLILYRHENPFLKDETLELDGRSLLVQVPTEDKDEEVYVRGYIIDSNPKSYSVKPLSEETAAEVEEEIRSRGYTGNILFD